MNKLQIALVVGLATTILCASYLYYRPSAAAQSVTETEAMALRRQVEDFFQSLLVQSSSSTAYRTILFTNFRPSDTVVSDMVQQTDTLTKSGTNWRHEHLDSKSVGDDLILIRYLSKSETHPVIWYFTFYRSQSSSRMDIPPSSRPWNCIGVKFDTNLDPLFNEYQPK